MDDMIKVDSIFSEDRILSSEKEKYAIKVSINS